MKTAAKIALIVILAVYDLVAYWLFIELAQGNAITF